MSLASGPCVRSPQTEGGRLGHLAEDCEGCYTNASFLNSNQKVVTNREMISTARSVWDRMWVLGLFYFTLQLTCSRKINTSYAEESVYNNCAKVDHLQRTAEFNQMLFLFVWTKEKLSSFVLKPPDQVRWELSSFFLPIDPKPIHLDSVVDHGSVPRPKYYHYPRPPIPAERANHCMDRWNVYGFAIFCNTTASCPDSLRGLVSFGEGPETVSSLCSSRHLRSLLGIQSWVREWTIAFNCTSLGGYGNDR